MITIKGEDGVFYSKKCILSDVTGNRYCSHNNAFIGQVGNSDKHQIFIITHNSIVLLKDPERLWDGMDCSVHIEEFVDLDVFISSKEK